MEQPPSRTVCEEAQHIVYGDRERAYDHPSRNFERIAALWNAHILSRFGAAYPQLTVEDVAWMMMQVKQARQAHLSKRDNLVDAIGYIACIAKMEDHAAARRPVAGIKPLSELLMENG